MNKEEGRQLVQQLVNRFDQNHREYTRPDSGYNETQLRTDFIDPFLEALGWDVTNEARVPQHLRELVQEDTVEIEDEVSIGSKKPDYSLRLAGKRKLFVEAKKPGIRIESASEPAFQVRRYGWNARLPISVLTNFDKLSIYDCQPRPRAGEEARIARSAIFACTQFVERFDELYDMISRESVYSGHFDQLFPADMERVGTERFDEYFLAQIEDWRKLLAADLVKQNPRLDEESLKFLVQRILNRIIFLRICEDRELERYKALASVKTYDDLKSLFAKADERYNSGLFDFIDDKLSLNVIVGSEVLAEIFRQLYYPESPFAFSVVEASVLGEIYEEFLGKEVGLDEDGNALVVDKPEVIASRGVVPTPDFVVDWIVENTLAPLTDGKNPAQLATIRLADICCGSGTFLLGAYEYLLNYHLEWYIKDNPVNHPNEVYEGAGGQYRLTLFEKQRILTSMIYGVDIDIEAVEVTQFSLLLKVLEGASSEAIEAHLAKYRSRALPNLGANIQCGNSLVDDKYFEFDEDAVESAETIARINPFDWSESFRDIIAQGGFDAIVGNPPYIRIQNMKKYSKEEVDYYQSSSSGFSSSHENNFDKYYLFIERGLSLLKEPGLLGYIVPHKFFTITAGESLRELISSARSLDKIVHFGVQQVFGKKTTTYTAILILGRPARDQFTVEHVGVLDGWRRGQSGEIETFQSTYVSGAPWRFPPPGVRELFKRVKEENPKTLKQVADIFVGVQTSADKIYIIHPTTETDELIGFTDADGKNWEVEKTILRPSLLDVHLEPFGSPAANTYIIFPYEVNDGRAVLYSPKEMAKRFPKCWKYLKAHKTQLEARNIQNGTKSTWYRYGRSQSLVKFNGKPLLIWPTLSIEPRYAFDHGNIVVTGGGNGPYYLLRPKAKATLSIFYLQAILSHPLIDLMVTDGASKFRGDYASHGKQFVAGVPIRQINFSKKIERTQYREIVRLAQELVKVTKRKGSTLLPEKERVLENQRKVLRRRIDQLINSLYHVSAAEINVVKGLTGR